MNLISMLFLYILKVKEYIKPKHFILLLFIILMGVHAFGLFGNARLHSNYGVDEPVTNSNLILLIGGSTERFRDSFVPNSFFWTYIYATSPLANLQYTISHFYNYIVDIDNFFVFILYEIIPDFISNRLVSFIPTSFEVDVYLEQPLVLITPELTARTAFARSYIILGWSGMIFYSLILFLFGYSYIILTKKISSNLFLTGYVTLCTLFVMTFFSNMLTFSGLSFQLIYPIILKIIPIKIYNKIF